MSIDKDKKTTGTKGFSTDTAVIPRPVSESFIEALRQAGARESLVHTLEGFKETAAPSKLAAARRRAAT